MQTGMFAASMQSTIAPATPAFSPSKPTMKPAFTKMPARWILWMLATMSPRVFCLLSAWISVAASGVSSPTKMAKKLLSRMSRSSSSSSARSRLASVVNSKGQFFASRARRASSRRNGFSARRFPIRLSSTKSTCPR